MRIQQLYNQRQTSNIDSGQQLRTGQIVRGNILRLFPNERAQIQLGNQQFVAQLQASLAVGKSYHFQIQQVDDDLIHLKVLSEVGGDQRTNMANILRQFGLTSSRHEINFLYTLIKERIPIQQFQLTNAMYILSNASNKSQAQNILKQMFLNQLPITKEIFQALYERDSESFTKMINEFRQALQTETSPTSSEIKQVLRGLQGNSELAMQRTLSNAISNQSINQFLQSMGIISRKFKKTNILSQSSFNNIMNQLQHNKQSLISHANELLSEWAISPANSNPMSNTQFEKILQLVNDRIFPLLANEQQQYVTALLQNEHNPLLRLHQFFTYLANEQTYTTASELQSLVNYEYPKQLIRLQLSHTIHDIGLSHEHNVANDTRSSLNSALKPLLLQFLNESEGVSNDRAQQLLHFVTGLQIQSVQESAHFIQANIVLHGEKLGLHNDIELEFESNKTPDGKVNPDFCRILFYLDLAHLNETVIDMHIQNRHVSITVFNDASQALTGLVTQFKPRLEAGLQSLNYDLTTITFKPFQQKNDRKINAQPMQNKATYEGIDFRI